MAGTIIDSLENLKKQMKESEKVAYEIFDNIPAHMKLVANSFINDVRRRLEAENKKVWKKIVSLEESIKSIYNT